jgi:hypothetical protein
MGFEPPFPESEQPQTHALEHAATGVWLCLSFTNCAHIINNI